MYERHHTYDIQAIHVGQLQNAMHISIYYFACIKFLNACIIAIAYIHLCIFVSVSFPVDSQRSPVCTEQRLGIHTPSPVHHRGQTPLILIYLNCRRKLHLEFLEKIHADMVRTCNSTKRASHLDCDKKP